jgi:hypothetical protein
MLFVGPYMVSGKSILTNSPVLAAADEAGDIDNADLKLAALGYRPPAQEASELTCPQ